MELVVIGHIMVENIYYPDGNKIGPVLGSPASYSSVCSGVLGTNTGLVTVIGKDMPYYLIEPFIKSGVDLKGINIVGNDSRTTDLKYTSDGRKKAYYRKVAPVIRYNHIPEEYLKVKTFFICPQDFEIDLDIIDKLKKGKKFIITDLGGFGGVVSTRHPTGDDRETRKIVKSIISKFDIVKASLEDSFYLFGDAGDNKAIIDRLHSWGANIVILTLGAKGSIISTGGSLIEINGLKVDAVDTTGAGDAYSAAFLSKFLKTKNLRESASYANIIASYLTTKKGGVNIERIPNKEMLKDFKKIVNQ